MSESIIYQPSVTTHWRNLFESKAMLLGAHNLNQGEELVVKITGAGIQSIKNKAGKEEKVPVITFENANPMVLNITNTKTIASLYGDLYENWIGRSIQVYAAKVKAFGVEQMALRVKLVIPPNLDDMNLHANNISACKTLDELKSVYMALPMNVKGQLSALKDQVKSSLEVAQ